MHVNNATRERRLCKDTDSPMCQVSTIVITQVQKPVLITASQTQVISSDPLYTEVLLSGVFLICSHLYVTFVNL